VLPATTVGSFHRELLLRALEQRAGLPSGRAAGPGT